MPSALPGHLLLPLIASLSIVVLSLLLMLIRPRGVAEVYWIGGGVFLLLLCRLISPKLALHAIAKGLDVYFFLAGMMLLSELAHEHGVFDWLAAVAVRMARGSRLRLFSLVYGVGVVVTIFMSNDATAVVLTPAVLAAVRKARVEPLPYLFACALVANAASFALPISNPANLVVFRDGLPPLVQWMLSFGLPSLLSIIATYVVLRLLFRRDLSAPLESPLVAQPLSLNGKLVVAGLGAVVTALMATSAMGKDLGLPTFVAALAITGAICIRARSNPLSLVRGISWPTLLLVAGLFVMVDTVESMGALRLTAPLLISARKLSPAGAACLTGTVVAVANNLVNNLPLGLLAGGTLHAAHAHGLVAQAVLIGVDLGPNLSVTGSLATILWLLALRKEGLHVSFGGFLRVGVIAMTVALLLALGGAILMDAFVHAV